MTRDDINALHDKLQAIDANPTYCVAPVGDPPRAELVEMDVMIDAVAVLGNRARREGNVGSEIDERVVEWLPSYLDTLLHGNGGTVKH